MTDTELQQDEDPPSRNTPPQKRAHDTPQKPPEQRGLGRLLKRLLPTKVDNTLRETLQEYITEYENSTDENLSISAHEKTLISNILSLRDMKVSDAMVPRVDIIAIPEDTSQSEILQLLSERQYSRIPVYRDSLDYVLGSVHIKDILAALANNQPIVLKDMIRDVPIVSPSMYVLDLLLQMRMTRKHMVLVVDEFGGIDGLITINDLIETIVGEIDDEHDMLESQPQLTTQTDGSVLADARVHISEFEDEFGEILEDDEREDNDTLGGLVFSIAGRVPARGEILKHNTGMVFEILEADPRRISRMRIHNIPQFQAAE